MPTVSLTEKTSHLAWCALISLYTARQDGFVVSESQESIFLTRWLANALKQHRFSREIAPDINWLLKQGRAFGTKAKLRQKLEYLWRSCNGLLSEQNDLFRLTYAIETAKLMGWAYRRLNDREWIGRNAVILNSDTNGIYFLRSSLEVSFDDNGMQTSPLIAKLTGNISNLETVFNRCGWHTEAYSDTQIPFLYELHVSSETIRDN
nr:DUF2913 family protein [Pantoea cypripedii]